MKHQPPQDPATPLKELKIKPAGSGCTWDHLGLGLGTRLPHYPDGAFLHHPPYPAPNFKIRQRVPREFVASVSSPAGLAPVGPRVWMNHLLHVQPWESSRGIGKREVLPGPRQRAPEERSVNLRTSCRSGPGCRGSGGNHVGPRAASRSSLSPAQPWHSGAAALGSWGGSIGLSWSVAQPACELRMHVRSLAPH